MAELWLTLERSHFLLCAHRELGYGSPDEPLGVERREKSLTGSVLIEQTANPAWEFTQALLGEVITK